MNIMATAGEYDNKFLSQYAKINRGAKFHFTSGVGFYTAPAFSRIAGFDHGFTARSGGVSEGYYASLNLSFSRPERRENVMENYRIFCNAADIPFDSMVMDNYEHGTNVLRVDRTDAGKGYLRDALPACDGLVTDDPAITLITGHADCMAFYCIDPVRRCIGPCACRLARCARAHRRATRNDDDAGVWNKSRGCDGRHRAIDLRGLL